MKYLLIFPLLLARCFAQSSDQPCDQLQAVINLSAGTPWNTYVEAGAMGIAGNIGLYAGVIEFQSKTGGKASILIDKSSFYIRQSYTILRTELGEGYILRGYITGLIGPHVAGLSTRLGIGDLSDNIMFMVEPEFIERMRVNAMLLIRF